MALTWTLSLNDRMSGAASTAKRSMTGLQKAMAGASRTMARGFAASSKNLSSGFKSASKGFSSFASGIGKGATSIGRSFQSIGKGFQNLTKSTSRGGGQGGGGMGFMGASAASAAGNMAAQAGMAALGAGVDFGKQVFDGAAMRQSVDMAMKALLGGTKQADAAFNRIVAKAHEIGAPVMESAKQVQGLLAMGFKMDGANSALDVLEATKAMKFVMPEANIDNIVRAFSQIQGKGKLAMEELKGQLGDAGINVPMVLDNIGKALGKTREEVEGLMQKGKITSDVGMSAIFKSIEQQGGDSLNNLAKAGKNSMLSIKERLMHMPEDLGAALKLDKPLATMSKLLTGVMDRVSKMDLSRIFEDVTDSISGVFNIFSKVDIVGPLQAITSAIKSIVKASEGMKIGEALDAFASISSGAIKGFGEGFAAAMEGAKSLSPSEIRESAHGFAQMGIAMGKVTGYVIQIIAGLQRMGAFRFIGIEMLVAAGEGISKAFAAIGSLTLPSLDISGWISGAKEKALAAATALGVDIASGVAAGISGGAPSVGGALAGIANAALGFARSDQGAHSPATKPRDKLGVPIGQGVTVGIQSQASNTSRALGTLAGTAVTKSMGTGRQAGETVGRGLRGGAASGRQGDVHFHGGIHTQAIDQRIIAEGTKEVLRGAVNRA